MQTTVTLDEDVAAELASLCRSTGEKFNEMANSLLRRSLSEAENRVGAFVVEPQKMGAMRGRIPLDKISEVMDSVDGPQHR